MVISRTDRIDIVAENTKLTDQTFGMEQAQQAVDTYFDLLKKSVASCPSGGSEFGEKLKHQAGENINAVHEHVKRLSRAKDFGEAFRIQSEFLQSQMTTFGQQAAAFAEAFTKASAEAAKKSGS
jgi:hypothetical protein